MGTSLLQEFLSSRLLDIGAEDSRLEKLENTCGELAKTYATNPQSALPPLMAAWDPSAGEDPSLLLIGSVLQNHWPTYRGAFKGEPLTLYRAVVLESVMRAMESQGVLAVAVSLIAANILPQLKVGQEARILDILVGRADAITAERLEQAWPEQSSPTNLAPLNVPAIKTLGKIDENAWFAQVAAASGPNTNKEGVTLANPNPHFPNQAQHWSWEFASRMAPILSDVHDRAAANTLQVVKTAFKGLADAVAAKLNEFLQAEQVRSNQREAASRLLWWRQSLYSQTAEKPYRKLPAALVAWHMALDMSDLLPEVYPPAVESLLFESVRAATGAQGEAEITLKELLQVDGAPSQLSQLTWLTEQRTTASRTLLVQALANSYGAGSAELAKLGVDAELKMLPGDWAIWLLREIKALETLAAPDELGCKVGESSLQQCKFWQTNRDAQEQSAVAEPGDGARLPWTGNAMGAGDIGFLSGATRTRLVGVFGVAGSGKTSLLGAWYLLIGRGIAPRGISFAGSLTLEGWENIAGNLRWTGAHGPSFPPHTSSGSGRHPGLLHLDLQVDDGRHDLLFADAPGEWFSRWSVRREAEDAVGAAWLSGAADVLLVIADSEELAGERLGTARASLQNLLRRVGTERRGRPVALVWTKCDVQVDEQMRTAVKNAADLALGTYETFSVSMHAAPGQEPYNRGQGLLELLDWVVRVDDAAFPKKALQHPEQDILQIVGGVRA